MAGRRRFTRDRQGRFHPHLGAQERELLEALPREAQGLLVKGEPAAARLFPVAYPDDPVAEADYEALMGEGLLARHQGALDTLAQTAGADSLDEDELHQWLGALEVLRLVLGTELDVSEDVAEIDALDPRAPQYAMYAYLSMLQGEIVEVLAASLPEGSGE
ncbi:MAG: DUF2017 family protein [Acidimicrobiales bacterium]